MVNAVICPKTGKAQEYRHLLKGPDKLKWIKAVSNKIVRLLLVIGYIKIANTCFSIHSIKVPQVTKVTYSRIFCDTQYHTKETHIVKITVVGDKLTFDISVSTPTSEVTTSKLCWKSVILTPGAKTI